MTKHNWTPMIVATTVAISGQMSNIAMHAVSSENVFKCCHWNIYAILPDPAYYLLALKSCVT